MPSLPLHVALEHGRRGVLYHVVHDEDLAVCAQYLEERIKGGFDVRSLVVYRDHDGEVGGHSDSYTVAEHIPDVHDRCIGLDVAIDRMRSPDDQQV
jgi:aromatic ring-cleaving dioxygenase